MKVFSFVLVDGSELEEKESRWDGRKDVAWMLLQSLCRITPLAVYELGLFLPAGD
jgi:hypothetical protein